MEGKRREKQGERRTREGENRGRKRREEKRCSIVFTSRVQ